MAGTGVLPVVLPVVLSLLIALLTTLPASAAVVGVRIATVTEDDETGEVTFDLTAFHTNDPTSVVLGENLDQTLNVTYTTVFGNYYGLGSVNYRVILGARSDWNTLPHPAVMFGDGDTIPMATLALQGQTTVGGTDLYAYRLGSLSHTYDAGSYMARAAVGPDGGTLPGLGRASTVDVATGYPITGALNNTFSVSRLVYPTSNLATPVYSYAASSVFNYPATLRYITARQVVTISGGGPPAPNSVEIPTLSEGYLLALAGLLAASGLLLLRRSA